MDNESPEFTRTEMVESIAAILMFTLGVLLALVWAVGQVGYGPMAEVPLHRGWAALLSLSGGWIFAAKSPIGKYGRYSKQ